MQEANAAQQPTNKITGMACAKDAYFSLRLIHCSMSAMNKMPIGKCTSSGENDQ